MYENESMGSVSGMSFTQLRALIRAADGLSLAQVCSFTGLEPTTVQNWIKRGFVPHPERKRYGERHMARILLIDALRECLQIDRIGELMSYINGDADDTSDDIISEESLYQLMIEATAAAAEEHADADNTVDKIADVVSGYVDDDSSRKRITSAVTVMVNARTACLYKQKADKAYAELFNIQNT